MPIKKVQPKKQFPVYFTSPERARIRLAADREQLSVSEWIRAQVLQSPSYRSIGQIIDQAPGLEERLVRVGVVTSGGMFGDGSED
jgi:hypothetical protein